MRRDDVSELNQTFRACESHTAECECMPVVAATCKDSLVSLRQACLEHQGLQHGF